MRVRIGCHFIYDSGYPTPMLVALRPRRDYHHHIIDEHWSVTPVTPLHSYIDIFGNEIWRLTAPVGALEMRYDAVADVPSTPDPVFPDMLKTAVEDLPDEVILYTLPSRYCPSDLFINEAWAMFGHIEGGWAQVQAICDWLHSNVTYGVGSTTATTGWDSYQARRGVCRDFAHLGISFCRALNLPARYVCGYLPDINVPVDPAPMDFHAWFEVYLEGAWRTFDARHNRPRTGRVLIACGRDAVDVAFATIYGSSLLTSFKVWADQVDDDARLEDAAPQHGNPHD